MSDSKQMWLDIKERFERFDWLDSIKLSCDGFDLTLRCEKIRANKLVWAVFVNGIVKGEWLVRVDGKTPAHEESIRFFQVKSKSLFSEKDKAVLGGLSRLNTMLNLDEKTYYCEPYWVSFNSFKRHIIANNRVISWRLEYEC